MVDPLNRERGRHLLEKVATAFAHEIAGASGEAVIRSHLWPTASSLIDHLGRNYLWAAEIVRSGGPVARNTLPRANADGLRGWFEDCRDELLAALAAAGPDTPCWTLFDREGTAGFWSRRMTFETVKHLIDIRAADGGVMVPAAELAAVDYADGIDELFEVFLARSRATLPRLPRPLALEATDLDRRWRFDENWNLMDEGAGGTVLTATAGDLALLVWERADPLARAAPFRIDGPPDAVEAFAAAPIHP